MELIVTKDAVYKNRWDHFMITNVNGNHLQLSDWLASYESYGFDYELVLIIENDKILGGFGAVIAKFSFFKFYCIPGGPIAVNNTAEILKKLAEEIPVQAKKHKACYLQMNAPILHNSILFDEMKSTMDNFQIGNSFKYVYTSNGLNWLDFKKYKASDEILLDFKSSVRRDIRNAERKETQIRFLKTESDIKNAYDLCLLNAKNNNYSLRDWNSFKPTIMSLINKNWSECIASYKDGIMKGAIFIVKSGNYYTYILGGTIKEKPDLLTGHLLQWEAIKFSFEQDCDGYNLSLGGSEGVKEFKQSFVSEQIFYQNSKYHLILKPRIFNFFLFFEKKIKPYKKNIAAILSKFKRK